MFRLLTALSVAVACLVDPARAEITHDSILEAIRAGDIEKVERDLASAHGDFLSGDAPADDMRRIYGVFGTTDPKVLNFSRDWLDRYPRSPYAHAAQAWNDYQAA
ncbi:hypothetical protein [Roseovarius aestuariivivens]|uniref:hypothetical protein n=1 Tax=Roseovarius aestuariivivens TaxID=1888910 RepID=UPI001080FBD1|nr:hypothetical protein [Roseovarius aestuariivivens]